jgi:hypothetical protein
MLSFFFLDNTSIGAYPLQSVKGESSRGRIPEEEPSQEVSEKPHPIQDVGSIGIRERRELSQYATAKNAIIIDRRRAFLQAAASQQLIVLAGLLCCNFIGAEKTRQESEKSFLLFLLVWHAIWM